MALSPVAGTHIYIGGVLDDKPVDFVAADFASQTWTEIDGYQSAGPLGDAAQEIATDLINRGRTVLQKGTRRSPATEHVFATIKTDPGQIALRAAQKTAYNYAFRLVDADAPAARSGAVTMTIAAPGVFTQVAHGMAIGTPVKFATTGALPTGLAAGTTYYVVSAPTADTYTVSATAGGSAITTTGTQSGTHIATTVPTPSEIRFIALVMGAPEQRGTANNIKMLSVNLAPNSNIVDIPATGA
jgi:hypothetical protein